MTAHTTQWNLDPKLAPKSFSEMALSSDMREQLEMYFEDGFAALLFVGDLGTGKTTSANIFAKKFRKNGGKVHLSVSLWCPSYTFPISHALKLGYSQSVLVHACIELHLIRDWWQFLSRNLRQSFY